MDALVEIVLINHVNERTVWGLRMGVHLFAAVWIWGVSWGLGGVAMWIALPLGIGLLAHASRLGSVAKIAASGRSSLHKPHLGKNHKCGLCKLDIEFSA